MEYTGCERSRYHLCRIYLSVVEALRLMVQGFRNVGIMYHGNPIYE